MKGKRFQAAVFITASFFQSGGVQESEGALLRCLARYPRRNLLQRIRRYPVQLHVVAEENSETN